jgi:hypothetical protein
LPPLQEFLDRLDDGLPSEEFALGTADHAIEAMEAEASLEHSTVLVEEENITHEEE